MNYSSNAQDALNQFRHFKKLSLQVADYLISRQETLKEGASMLYCAHEVRVSPDSRQGDALSTWYCRHAQCPICQWRKSLRWQQRAHALLNSHPEMLNGKWLYITLTVGNCEIDSTRHIVDLMRSAFTRLTKRAFWTNNVCGGFRFLEVAEGIGAEPVARPHFHCLIQVRPSMFEGVNYVTESEWTAAWSECLQFYSAPYVDVQRVLTTSEPLRPQLLRIVGYSTKPRVQLPSREWMLSLTTQLKHQRYVEPLGAFRPLMADVKLAERMGHFEGAGRSLGTWNSQVSRWNPELQDYEAIPQRSGWQENTSSGL